MKLHYLFYSVCLFMTVILSSCSDDVQSSDEPAGTETVIRFNVSVNNDWQGNNSPANVPASGYSIRPDGDQLGVQLTGTMEHGINAEQPAKATQSNGLVVRRAMMVGSANFYDNFYLYGYAGSGRLSVKKGNDGKFQAEGQPSATATNVTAIAPQKDLDYSQGKINIALDGNTLDQTDIMVATDNVEANSTNLDLNFHHIFSAVNFKVGKLGFADNVRINSITIEGIYTKGSYDVNGDVWTLSATGNEQADLSTVIRSTDASMQENVMLTSGTAGNAFMILPQTTPAAAKIKVSLTFDNQNRTLTFPFGGKTLVQGKTVTFGIGSGDDALGGYVLSVTSPADIYPFEDNYSQNFVVKSYKNDANKTPVAWTVVGYSTDGGSTWTTDQPEAMALDALSGRGGQDGNSVVVTMSKPAEGDIPQMTKQLRSAKTVSNYDLSLHDVNGNDISRSTANTYVVRAGGTYLIPLVIGNTIKDGKTHIFNGTYANTFVDWKERQVTSSNYKITEATGARLLWSDAGSNVISDLKIVDGADGLKYLKFSVSKDNIAPGNALLAVTARDGGKEVAVWSWQIWMTSADLSYTIPVKGFTQNKRTYDFCPLPLGSKGNTKRRVLLRIRQAESGKTAVVTLDQMLGMTSYDGTYYQWGRKDPMPRTMPAGFTTQAQQASLATAIQHPECFYHNGKNWCSAFHADLWSTARKGNGAWEQNGKTIYDPSPVGFKVPSAAAWSFVDNNMLYGRVGNGFCFYTSSAKNKSELIYIPMAGYIDSGSAATVNNNGSNSVYWSSDNQSISNRGAQAWGILLYGGTYETVQHLMARACTVMPILDTDELSYPESSNWK